MAKKSMKGNVGAIIAGGAAIVGVAALWYWWWVWYQAKKETPGAKYQLAKFVELETPEKSEHDDATADPDTAGVGFWGDPLSEEKVAQIGT